MDRTSSETRSASALASSHEQSAVSGQLGLEHRYDAAFVAALALREKQVQQSYRPIISIHKWFARRPGSVFRSLMLAEFVDMPLRESYWLPHDIAGSIGDPFMGGGTSVFEGLRLGLSTVGSDVNPMSYWLVKQAVEPIKIEQFVKHGEEVWNSVKDRLGHLWTTTCTECSEEANAKYFFWAKSCVCPACASEVALMPNYRIAGAARHTHQVFYCPQCDSLKQLDPDERDLRCASCSFDLSRGNVTRQKATCVPCGHEFNYAKRLPSPPNHHLVGLEYNCPNCYHTKKGRQFKSPDDEDVALLKEVEQRFAVADLDLPDDEIPPGDETDRLLRWGYTKYAQLFTTRQLLGLGTLSEEIRSVEDRRIRQALATVFSDFLRYQNLLCRYDPYALKCQDIFAVHGYPVGLVACENNLPGIAKIGSGSWIHFVSKFAKAKKYAQEPFEKRLEKGPDSIVRLFGESIEADLRAQHEPASDRHAVLTSGPSQELKLIEGSLDGVFTDPPYYANVQYAELMDFCFIWLRRILAGEDVVFDAASTRTSDELTGNATMGRGLPAFTEGLSQIFQKMAFALRKGAPLVFTYHHNQASAYAPLVVALLDSQMTCTAVLPAPAEMSASIHIAGTKSSIIDSVFVCRDRRWVDSSEIEAPTEPPTMRVQADVAAIADAGYCCTPGDRQCLTAGHAAADAIRALAHDWDSSAPTSERLGLATQHIGWSLNQDA